MNPTTLAWILVAVGAFLLFASLGNFDWLHTRERRERAFSLDWRDLIDDAISGGHETDSDPTSRA